MSDVEIGAISALITAIATIIAGYYLFVPKLLEAKTAQLKTIKDAGITAAAQADITLASTFDGFQKDQERQSRRFASLEAQYDNLSAHSRAEYAILSAQVTQERNQRVLLEKELDESRSGRNTYKVEIAQLTNRIHALEELLTAATTRFKVAEKRVVELDDIVKQLLEKQGNI